MQGAAYKLNGKMAQTCTEMYKMTIEIVWTCTD